MEVTHYYPIQSTNQISQTNYSWFCESNPYTIPYNYIVQDQNVLDHNQQQEVTQPIAYEFQPEIKNYHQYQVEQTFQNFDNSLITFHHPSNNPPALENIEIDYEQSNNQNDDLDFILNEFDLSEIDKIFSSQDDTDDLSSLLQKVIESKDFCDSLDQDLDFVLSDSSSCSNLSSASSTPKRKCSIDSSDYSSDCFETLSLSSGRSNYSSGDTVKAKRHRRSKHTKEEKVSRKKQQNKKAASKYRSKKKTELEIHEQTLEELERRRDELFAQYKKIETEFDVILPLATAAFKFDPIRFKQIQELNQRLSHLK